MRIQKIKQLPLIALMIFVSAFLFAGTMTAYAAAEPLPSSLPKSAAETLSVDEVWLTGDVLHIAVTDTNSGEKQTLELKLSDYAKPGDEYVSVQATDGTGRTSNIIQFKNPYYVPAVEKDSGTDEKTSDGASESAIPDGSKPFTPNGAGSVVDNATNTDGKEFFTVETADGNTFYLIVDRQRNAENVYFLNAVTEDDLMSLAKPGNGKASESAIPNPKPTATAPATEKPPETTPPPPAEKSNNNTGTMALVIGAVVLVGGVGYYFKIVRPKKNAADDYDNGYDEPDGDTELPLDDDESEVDGE